MVSAAVLVLFSLAAPDAKATGISFHKQLRPILQANCYGCHQPAKAKGGYVMTAFDKMLAGGESNEAAIVKGVPDKSALVKLITAGKGGEAEMPKGKKALSSVEVDLIKKWIAEGAVDDTPDNAKARFDMDHPPIYTRQPVISSLDYSPDGKWLAVAGFHEVLLYKADGSERVARLVGLSERIQSLAFSPDGKWLAVTGGLPGRTGEVQVWEVEKRKLALSAPITFDTVYGVSWSPDGKRLAFGCADNSVRAIDAKTGEQVLFQGTHNDWVLGTVFSTDGTHLASVGRDRTAKLTEVASQRFVDNITSITPGALKGGIAAVIRHPKRDEIVIGGADGVPKVYRMHRVTKRVIGDDSNLVKIFPAMNGRISSLAVSRDGRRFVAGSGLDSTGEVAIFSYDFDTRITDRLKMIMTKRAKRRTAAERALLDAYTTEGAKLIARTAIPHGSVYAVAYRPDGKVVAAAGSDGTVRFIDATSGNIVKEVAPAPLGGPGAVVASSTAGAGLAEEHADFIRDVNPVMTKVGCNSGTCHGAAQGKNGFKLSLRGYDPILDVRALTDDLGSRRTNMASPDDSLMLMKATGAVPHVGGQLVKPGDDYYRIMRSWIASGTVLQLDTPRVAKIEVSPKNPTIDKAQGKQQMRVVATYSDGKVRDVTREAFVESGNPEVAAADRTGAMTAIRRGEAAVLARYEGAYAATTLTVMGDRNGFVWQAPPTNNKVDELVADKWRRMKILPSPLTTDAEFIRRVSLDLTGLPPSSEQVATFLADARPTKAKRDTLVDKLIGSDAFIDHWTNKWSDLLQVNRKFLGADGATAFRNWIRNEVATNTPYDQFSRKILTAGGSNRENPAAAYYKILRDPGAITENTTHLFLAVRFNCNKCHDHPFERWTQDQYYETAAFFSRVGLKPDPQTLGETIGGTAVEGAKPLYEVVYEKEKGDVLHERTGKPMTPKFPFEVKVASSDKDTHRDKFAAWVTSAQNPYFAKSYVNRLWGYLLGIGIVEPIDDMRAGNPATNPELLDYLTKEFVGSKFDMRHVLALICKSRTYQLSVATNKWNADDKINYSHAAARRLPAEVLYDAIHQVTGSISKLPGQKPGTRAASATDSAVEAPGGFLATFGRPSRESTCECERTSELRLGAVMSLVSGPTIAEAIADPENAIATLTSREKDDAKLVNGLFMRILNRPATPQEVTAALGMLKSVDEDHGKLSVALAQRKTQVATTQASLAKERETTLAKAKADLDAYEKEFGPGLKEREAKRAEEMAKLDRELRQYEETLPKKLAEWEKKQKVAGDWVSLVPSELEATNGAKLIQETDLSVYASDENTKGNYIIQAETDLRGITAIRLEALADKRLPGEGPGRGTGGRFTLTGIEVQVAPRSNPAKTRKIVLRKPLADFTEEGYDLKAAVDPKTKGKGWSISPATGVTHWATFETKEAVGFPGGTILTITLLHNSEHGDATLGRFRLSVGTGRRPVGLSLPDDLRAILSREAEEDDKMRTTPLMKYIRATDVELQKRMTAYQKVKKPLPLDPKLKDLRERFEQASEPLAEDPTLVQLRDDMDMSSKQMASKRLTVAQDLAWALINSPAFLFNR